jgi:hypothetical protein
MDQENWTLSQISAGAGSARMPLADDAINDQTCCSVSCPRGTALVLMGGLIYLYLILFSPPFIPIYSASVGTIYISQATRILQGEVLYRDFFELTPPGTELVYCALFKLFGFHHWIHNATLLVLGMSFLWLSIVISRRVLPAHLVFLPGALFLSIPFAVRLDGTHHWFSCLAVTSVLAILIDRRTPVRIVAAGGLCGVALCFTQLRGLFGFLGLGAFLFWEWREKQESWKTLFKNQLLLILGFLIAPVVVDGYFIWKVGLERFLFCTVVFGLKYYAALGNANSFGAVLTDLSLPLDRQFFRQKLAFLFVLVGTPLSYLLFFLRGRQRARKGSDAHWGQLLLVAIVGISLLLSVASTPAGFRVAPGMLPALILLVWLMSTLTQFRRSFVTLLWFGVLGSALFGAYWRQTHWRTYFDTPGGRIGVHDQDLAERLVWLQERSRPGEYMFDTHWPIVNVALGLRNPTPIPALTDTDYTRPEQVEGVISGLEKHQVHYVLWSAGDLIALPNERIAPGDHLEPLRRYLRTNYQLAATFTDGTPVLERNSLRTHP